MEGGSLTASNFMAAATLPKMKTQIVGRKQECDHFLNKLLGFMGESTTTSRQV